MKLVFTVLACCLSTLINAQTLTFKKGDVAPLFTATAHSGKVIDLKKSLNKGPVILLFYRGYWCPYCNKQLSHLNDSLALLQNKGATVFAITPEKAASVAMTIGKTKASFDIISDTANELMKLYGVDFKVDEKTVDKYKTYGIDFTTVNGNTTNTLPVPAVFIIDTNGKFSYLYFDKNYTKRPSVRTLLENL